MAIRDLFPSLWRGDATAVGREKEMPLYNLQVEMNRAFDDFFQGVDVMPFTAVDEYAGKFSPAIDIAENDTEIVVTAELPGLDKKDFELLVTDGALTIKGEKREEREDKGKGYRYVERGYGYFSRVIPLPPGIDTQAVDAKYTNGILRITLPRKAPAKSGEKRISIAVK
jgi:HSP20 family protein